MAVTIFKSDLQVKSREYLVHDVTVEQSGEYLKVRYKFKPVKRWRIDHLSLEEGLKFMWSHAIDFDITISVEGLVHQQGSSKQGETGSGSGVELVQLEGRNARSFKVEVVDNEGIPLGRFPRARTLPIPEKPK